MKIFETDNLEELIASNNIEVWDCVIHAINLGIEEGLSTVPCFKIQNNDTIVTFQMHRSEWAKFLDNAIEIYSKLEEYEICADLQRNKKFVLLDIY